MFVFLIVILVLAGGIFYLFDQLEAQERRRK
jgi:hypothetical protein